jgi:hypothetical protein
MTKEQFLQSIKAMYLTLNASDSENAESWTTPKMAGSEGCGHLDKLLGSMVREGVMTQEEHQQFMDTM